MHWEHIIMLETRCECWGTRASWIRVFDVHVVMEFEKILGRLKKMIVDLLPEDFLCDICNVMNFLQAIHNMFLVHFSS
jgi:hypothetical protein